MNRLNKQQQNGRPSNARLAYSVQESADILGLSYSSVFRLLQRGKLRSARILRHHVIPKAELERILRENLQ
jgi:excisionase family DNA binding protein